jgi:hypothetical protein
MPCNKENKKALIWFTYFIFILFLGFKLKCLKAPLKCKPALLIEHIYYVKNNLMVMTYETKAIYKESILHSFVIYEQK